MPDPRGMHPAWEHDSFTWSPTRNWIVVFHHHKISFCLNLGLESKGQVCPVLLWAFPGEPSCHSSLKSGLLASDVKSYISCHGYLPCKTGNE